MDLDYYFLQANHWQETGDLAGQASPSTAWLSFLDNSECVPNDPIVMNEMQNQLCHIRTTLTGCAVCLNAGFHSPKANPHCHHEN